MPAPPATRKATAVQERVPQTALPTHQPTCHRSRRYSPQLIPATAKSGSPAIQPQEKSARRTGFGKTGRVHNCRFRQEKTAPVPPLQTSEYERESVPRACISILPPKSEWGIQVRVTQRIG